MSDPAKTNPATSPLPRGSAEPTQGATWSFIGCASGTDAENRWADPWSFDHAGGPVVVGVGHALSRYEAGWRKFYVDSPFGKDTDVAGFPQFSWSGAMKVPATSKWRDGFERRWSTVADLPGVELLAYLGSFWADQGMRDAAEGRGDFRYVLKILRESVLPLKHAGFKKLAIDATCDTEEDSIAGECLLTLEAMGFDVLVESTPMRRRPWLTRFGTVRSTWFARNLLSFENGGHDFLGQDECRGEHIQVFNGWPTDPDWDGTPFSEWGWKWIKGCFAFGERPAFDTTGLDVSSMGFKKEIRSE